MMPIWTTRDFSGSNVWESIACSKVGQKRDCPMRRFCVAVLSASTRSTHFCNDDEGDFVTADSGPTRSTCCAVVCGSVSVLVKTRIHFVWRADRPDRDHANGAGRKEKMDQPIAISART